SHYGCCHGCQHESKTSRYAGVQLDQDLIRAVQSASVVQSRAYDPSREAVYARRLVQHIYLSLLRRYPSPVDEDQHLGRLAKGERIESIIASIMKSKEYRAILRWE